MNACMTLHKLYSVTILRLVCPNITESLAMPLCCSLIRNDVKKLNGRLSRGILPVQWFINASPNFCDTEKSPPAEISTIAKSAREKFLAIYSLRTSLFQQIFFCNASLCLQISQKLGPLRKILQQDSTCIYGEKILIGRNLAEKKYGGLTIRLQIQSCAQTPPTSLSGVW